MDDKHIKETFKQDKKRNGAPDSNMSYDEQNDNPMETGENHQSKRRILSLIPMKTTT